MLGTARAVTNANKFSGVQRGLGALFEDVTFFNTPTLILETRGPAAGLALSQQLKSKVSTALNFFKELHERFDPLII